MSEQVYEPVEWMTYVWTDGDAHEVVDSGRYGDRRAAVRSVHKALDAIPVDQVAGGTVTYPGQDRPLRARRSPSGGVWWVGL